MILIAVLLGVQAGVDAAPTRTAKADADKPICRTLEVTGSLAATRKVCKTKAEWDGTSRDAQGALKAMTPLVNTFSDRGS